MTYESKPGVWVDSYLEIDAYGDFIQNTYMLKSSGKVNDDINALYIISVVIDSYTRENLQFLKYVYYNGINWKISRIKAEYPRLIIMLDGDPFYPDFKIPTDRKSAEGYANNIIQTGIKSLRCSLNEEILTINFTPIKDKILTYYLNNRLVDMYIVLLVHNSSMMCNDNRLNRKEHHDDEWVHKNDINIFINSTDNVYKNRSLFNKRMLFKKAYNGITYVKLTSESISKGKVELNLHSLLNIEYVEDDKGRRIINPVGYIPKYYNKCVANSIYRYNRRFVNEICPFKPYDQNPEQTFSCELFTLCKVHEKDFNEDADVLYYEHDESLRKISENTVTYIYNFDI